MSRIRDLNTIRESGLDGGSNDFIPARLGIFICIFYDDKREKNMLMLTCSPALRTQGDVDQISDKVSLLMEGHCESSVTSYAKGGQCTKDRPRLRIFILFYYYYFLIFSFLARRRYR